MNWSPGACSTQSNAKVTARDPVMKLVPAHSRLPGACKKGTRSRYVIRGDGCGRACGSGFAVSIALILKLVIAFNTLGTNDVVSFTSSPMH